MLEGIKRVCPARRPTAPQAGAEVCIGTRSRPARMRGIRCGGRRAVRTYVDQLSGRFLVVMDLSRRSYAWIYYGLHTLEFPD